ncbi:hypothetical protein, partial [Rhodopseudomonas sp. BR0G17]|uniref:hypothetical protein n=1 Tax=Rhodopseudomonas sp. BR0G17 TaxID=2269368 RepID=UPI001967E240
MTSEEEERETWTAKSLRVSVLGSFGFLGLGPDERLRRYTFSRKHHVRERCEALRRTGDLRIAGDGGTSSNVV